MFQIPKNPGFIPRGPDARDIPYRAANNLGSIKVDWNRRTNIRKELNLKVEDQGSSSTCVGQAWSKYKEIVEFRETGQMINLSAEDIYAWIYEIAGGAYGYKGGSSLKIRGVAQEFMAPSYKNGLPPDEDFMRVKHTELYTRNDALVRKVSGYTVVDSNIEDFAHAILNDSCGMVFGVLGTNEGWQDKFVKPPVSGMPSNKIWGHFLTAIDIEVINGKKYVVFLNSWSKQWGDEGYGYLPEDYFASSWVFQGFKIQDLPNSWLDQINMKRVIRLEGTPDQFMVESGRKILIPDLDTRTYYRDILKIIPDSEPEVIQKAEFDSLMESESLSIGVMRAAKNAYPYLKDAFEKNQ